MSNVSSNCNNPDTINKEIDNNISVSRILSNPEALASPRTWLTLWLAEKKFTVSPKGNIQSNTGVPQGNIFNTLWLDYKHHLSEHNKVEKIKASNLRDVVSPVPESDMVKALQEHIKTQVLHQRNELTKSLSCTKENLNPIEQFILATTGACEAKHVALIAHWIWMIKRKMKGLPVQHHIMPIFYGAQGSGKTTAVDKLVKPIQNYRLNLQMNELADTRYAPSLEDNFVVIFDEMQGCKRADIDVLKNKITSDWNNTRTLHTHNVPSFRQNCSFFGTTNAPVALQIIDTTGMRRFYELSVLPVMDWTVINSIDYVALWQGVDENKDSYIVPFLDEIRLDQEELVTEDPLDRFFEDHNILVNGDQAKDVSVTDVYKAYRAWCESEGLKPYNNSWFGKHLSKKGLKSKVIKSADGVVRVYSLNATSRFPGSKVKLISIK